MRSFGAEKLIGTQTALIASFFAAQDEAFAMKSSHSSFNGRLDAGVCGRRWLRCVTQFFKCILFGTYERLQRTCGHALGHPMLHQMTEMRNG